MSFELVMPPNHLILPESFVTVSLFLNALCDPPIPSLQVWSVFNHLCSYVYPCGPQLWGLAWENHRIQWVGGWEAEGSRSTL